MKIWGCDAYVKNKSTDKLAPKSDKCYFIGYPKNTRRSYFYNRHENKVFVAYVAVFLELDYISRRQSGRKSTNWRRVAEDVSSSSNRVIVPSEPRRSGRVSRQPDRYVGIIELDDELDVLLLESDDSATYKTAISIPNSTLWQEAMQSEINSIHENQVWDLVDLPNDVRLLHCKYIFKGKEWYR
ncbi:uncharacterized protein LOC141613935 [Silene latifolia]|uniref:uncharacterized protein LOC141613935 n=1 Tax=Silene latifolia TaxID=37657 RepID=UPI003D76A9F9